ncbi:MAG: beta-phosphoglucomutase [Phototrophicales bacterium]
MIKALIFDLDGVITDTAEFHYLSWKRLADEENLSFTREDNEKLRGVSRRESLELILKGRQIPEETAQQWMARKNRYYQSYLETVTPADRLPGVTEFLTEARELGLKLAIGSASRNAKTVLERLDLLDAFDVVGDGYAVVNTKPAPDLFVWVAGGLGIRVVEGVVFEDAEAGVDAALQAGFWAVGIGRSKVDHAHLHLPNLDGVKVSEVLAHLVELNSTHG